MSPEYIKFINGLTTAFKKNQRIRLGELITELPRGRIILEGTLVVLPGSYGEIRLKLLEKDTPDKGFSVPLRLNNVAQEKSITANYLIWYFGKPFVKNYLASEATGAVFLRIPKRVLYSLLIPVPQRLNYQIRNSPDSIILRSKANDSKEMINSFISDYRLNFEKGRYRTSIILAGAICEIILYQLLLDNDIEKSLLEKDNGLALGKLISYVKLLKLDKHYNVPINHFSDLQKQRNMAVHVGAALKSERKFYASDLNCFDQIIKYFGI